MSQQADHLYEFGPFRLDAEERLLARDGAMVSLTPKAFDLLLALVERHGHLVTKEELFQAVWPDSFVEESNLSSNIALIRKALGDGENGLKLIETVPKRGYRFVAEVREVSPTSDDALIPEKAELHAEPPPLASATAPPASRRVRSVVFLAASAIVGVAGWAIWQIAFRPAPALPLPRLVPFTSFSGNECCPSFSPDGNQIAFVWNGEKGDNDDIYVKLIDAGAPLQLTANPARDTTPAWSPDGRHIAFIRSANNEKGIWLVPALGGQARKLCTLTPASSGLAWFLSWSPDGKLLAFSEKNSPQEPDSIFLLTVESLEKRRLTSHPERRQTPSSARRLTRPTLRVAGDYDPTFSPDGKMLAFIRSNADADEIYLVPTAGGEPQRLTHDNRGIDEGLAWTPDGREIVFASNRAGGYGFWRIPIVGGTPERLASGGDSVFAPTINRQGNRLAYTQYHSDVNIWRYEAHPGQTNAPARWISSTQLEGSPSYSADGARIVFVSGRSGSREIWVCESDGSNPIQITSFGGPEVGSTRWSPDGRQIVFDSNADGNKDIYVISAGGGKARRLTVETSDEVRPSWSRDGMWIYFGSNRSGAWQVWKAPAEGGPAVQVTQQGGREAYETTDGKFVYYTKGPGANSIWRKPVAGGEEIQVLDQVGSGQWAVVEQGIYLVNQKTAPRQTIEFFSFATARMTRIAVTEKSVPLAPPGFTVSPDGRWILLMHDDQSESDIMLMENFR